MSYRYFPPAGPLLIGYDPFCDLPADHRARLVEQVVEETVTGPPPPPGPGQPPFDPRLTLKVRVYGYSTGSRAPGSRTPGRRRSRGGQRPSPAARGDRPGAPSVPGAADAPALRGGAR